MNAIAALNNASNMIGMGLTMEGQEGNEIMYVERGGACGGVRRRC